MKFPSNTIHEIRSRLDLSRFISKYLPLKNNKCSCPFHVDKTPSFSILTKNQTWRCFGCGFHGDIFTFVRLMEKLSFSDAVTLLAQEAGVVMARRSPDALGQAIPQADDRPLVGRPICEGRRPEGAEVWRWTTLLGAFDGQRWRGPELRSGVELRREG